MKLKNHVILPLFLLVSIICVSECLAQDEVVSYTKVGQKIPAFSITDTAGKNTGTNELKGKVALVNFWATWCAPCRTELPRLEKEVWLKFRSDDFAMVAIAREQFEKEITRFRDKVGFTFPIASDQNKEIYNLFGNAGIPRSYVVGPDGTILFQSSGYIEAEFDRMVKIIESELSKLKKSKTEGRIESGNR